MRSWWVNQNQTWRQEWAGGYQRSPKRKANGARSPFYEFMREVAPGDLILSFQDTRIRRIGIARSYAYECPKPPEFGAAGPNWDDIGWKIDVRYVDPIHEIRPADHMSVLRPLLHAHYSPLLNVRQLESRCRVTEVERLEHLRASHIKPWRENPNEERLDGENGFLLTPTIVHCLGDRALVHDHRPARYAYCPLM